MALLVVLVIIIVSMVLHELAHGWVAYLLGDMTAKYEGRLTPNPIKHLDPFMSVVLPMMLAIMGGPIFGGAKPVPINTRNLKWREWGFALVALAGPITNLLLAFIGFLVGYGMGLFADDGGFWGSVMVTFVLTNLGFFVFNMIPLPPLDGSRVLYVLAPDFVRRVMMQMERYGILVVMALVMIFGSALSGFMSGVIINILRGFEWIVGA